MGNRQSKSEIARDILDYLNSNPDAQDTLAGIIEWWLLEEQIKQRTDKVKAAVADLVKEGLIIETVGKDSQTHYRINVDRAAEIKSLLDRTTKQRKKHK
ncbi:MAG TPA: hypothetical protein VKM94_21265 [Blastocatellia bacterium]|nr:hypothetical protein [Blastocatellia bacterium]